MTLTTDPLGGKTGVTTKALGLPPRTAALLAHYDDTTGSNSYTAPKGCLAIIRAYGPGGSGARDTTNRASGAGGGAVGYKVVNLAGGQVLSWSVGTPGAAQASDTTNGNDATDTTVTLPGTVLLTAGGGKKGVRGASPQTGGLGGVASGPWDKARAGGRGGDSVTGAGTAGESPTGGGTGGGTSSDYGGGGAAAGFSDLFPGITSGNGGAGNSTNVGGAPGGGSGGTGAATSGIGGVGRVIITILDVG